MASKRDKNQFGIDSAESRRFKWDVAASRILTDVKSDFIYAPHLSNVFRNAADEVIGEVSSELKNGRFSPGAPLTIEVPKSSRMVVASGSSLGPAFSRPGSILLPKDRLLYQVLADMAAPHVERATDRERSFSHPVSDPKDPEMFKSSRMAWDRMQGKLNRLSEKYPRSYVIKADVADCFGSINQHTLVNHLESVGFPPALKAALDALLVLNTGDRNSRGLLQGMFPSDLLGNFYLTPLDKFLSDLDVPSVRFVDDFYIFTRTLKQAEEVMRGFTLKLRDYDLGLNESKSRLLRSKSIVLEEPDLEDLFDRAIEERSNQSDDDEEQFDSDYGFQSEWDDEDGPAEDSKDKSIVVKATEDLFDSISKFPFHVEKIERFCLPLFAAADSDYAVNHVLEAFSRRPTMGQIFCSYLSKFLDQKKVRLFLEEAIENEDIHFAWQRMWILAALLTLGKVDDRLVKIALRMYRDGNNHEALRAVAAIFVAKQGSFTRQKELADNYSSANSVYVQTSLLYGARYFQNDARRAAIKSWSGHSPTHRLVAASLP